MDAPVPVTFQSFHLQRKEGPDYVSEWLVLFLTITRVFFTCSSIIIGVYLLVAAFETFSLWTLIVAIAVFANGSRYSEEIIITINFLSMVDFLLDHTLSVVALVCILDGNMEKFERESRFGQLFLSDDNVSGAENTSRISMIKSALRSPEAVLLCFHSLAVACLWKHFALILIYMKHVENRKIIDGADFDMVLIGPVETFVYKLYDNLNKNILASFGYYLFQISMLYLCFVGLTAVAGIIIFLILMILGYITVKSILEYPIMYQGTKLQTKLIFMAANIVSIVISYLWMKMIGRLTVSKNSNGYDEGPMNFMNILFIVESNTLFLVYVCLIQTSMGSAILQMISIGIPMAIDALLYIYSM